MLLIPLLAGCSSGHPGTAPGSKDSTSISSASLSNQEAFAAVAVARREVVKAGASAYSVTATPGPGVIKSTNTGHPCTSGRVLTIKLIGKFPHTVTTGHPVRPGQPPPDFTVRAEIIKADARTGVVCLIGVQTAENGEPEPLPNGRPLCGSTTEAIPCFKP